MLKNLLGNMKHRYLKKSVLKETFPMAKSNKVADKSLKTAVKSLKVIQWNTVVIEKVFHHKLSLGNSKKFLKIWKQQLKAKKVSLKKHFTSGWKQKKILNQRFKRLPMVESNKSFNILPIWFHFFHIFIQLQSTR